MEILVSPVQFADLRAKLPSLSGTARIQALLELAWHACELDTKHALQLAQEARPLLAQYQAQLAPSWHYRLDLIEARAALLFGNLVRTQTLAQGVLAANDGGHAPAADWYCTVADAHWLLASVAHEHGKNALGEEHWYASAAAARQAADVTREELALICRSYRNYRGDWGSLDARFGAYDPTHIANHHPAVASWLFEFWGSVAYERSEYAEAILRLQLALENARASCQHARCIIIQLGIGAAYVNLNDQDTGLQWKQRALQLAQECGWPTSIGICQVTCGESLRILRQFDAAREVLEQAFTVLASLPASYNYAHALLHRGNLALDEADWTLAQNCFSDLQSRSRNLNATALELGALRGMAETLLGQCQPQQALLFARAAFVLARQVKNPLEQVDALLSLARIHALLPEEHGGEDARLHYLHQALVLSENIKGHRVAGELLDALADIYAARRDFAQAYALAQRATAAREETQGLAATNRAIAMQVQHQTERSQQERKYHQQLAEAEALRVEVLQQTTHTLAHLSAIGQEITAHLHASAIIAVLHRHVQGLLDINAFAVYLLHDAALEMHFGVEDGVALPPASFTLDHPDAYAVRCVRERCEIILQIPENTISNSQVPGTQLSRSCLFAPLIIGQHVLGAMSVQAIRPHAFGERELLIFRSLCAYGAIALDNARAYRQLQDTKEQLVAQEKLAALGGLVAGVAHELNTPLGNSMLMASALQVKIVTMQDHLQQQTLRHAQLCEFLQDAEHASQLIRRSLGTAASLVGSFKQVAVDRTSEQKRSFDLRQTCQEVIATMMNQIRQGGHQLSLEIDDGIAMYSYPGPFGQVLGNLISNALSHAFAKRQGGQMRLYLSLFTQQQVQISFKDDGCGILAADQKRIFDPFFTTRMGQGHTGLGLAICHSIVTGLLGGQLWVRSQPGQGSCFVLELPRNASGDGARPEQHTTFASDGWL